MLSILERYLARTVVSSTAVTTIILSAVLFVMTLLGEFKNLGQGDYGLAAAVFYVLQRMPNQIYQFSPLLVLLGSIIALSLLTTHRELAVMRASGFSMRHIIYSIFVAAFILIVCISILGEFTGPGLSRKAAVQKENLQNAGQAVVTSSGVWLHIDNNFVHVQHVVGKHMLEGVTRYKFDNDHRLLEAYYAKTMIREQHEWVMHDAVVTKFFTNRTMSESLPVMKWDLHFNSNLLGTGMIEPDEMTLPHLASFAGYLEKNGLQSTQYRFEFWERLFTPFASLVMIFLAIAFVLGSVGQLPMGIRLMAGVVAGFAFFILNSFFGQLSIVYQVPPFIAAVFPIIIFALIGLVLAKNLLKT